MSILSSCEPGERLLSVDPWAAQQGAAPIATSVPDPLQVRLLGTVDVVAAGVVRPLAGLRRKAVLAALALHAGQTVASDFLIDVVWSGHTPATVVNTLQSHVSYLRRVLGRPDVLVASAPGYRLELGLGGTDVQALDVLLAAAGRATDLQVKKARLREAVGLWRGVPLAEVTGSAWLADQAERLKRMHHTAVTSLIEIRLALGEHTQLVPELEDLTAEHPFDEDLTGHLMLALYRAGRQADALAAFRRVRQRLDDELGIDPGRALRALEQAILEQSDSLELPSATISLQEVAVQLGPAAQLPPVAGELTGRQPELERMDAAFQKKHRTVGAGPRTVAISGMAGVGKSMLALQWAHRNVSHFPDGQLYLNLHGFDATKPAMQPENALQVLLALLGVPPRQLPVDLGALTGLYRSLLAGKRVLIVLDNARDAEQVRPLLPGTSEGMVLVTSRSDLSPLAITNSADLLQLKPLDAGAAYDLLTSRLDTVSTSVGDIEAIAARCEGLPLALVVAAAQVNLRPYAGASDLVDGMRTNTGLLDILDGGDSATDLRRVFGGTYRRLSDQAAEVFRSISRLEAAEITPAGVARYAMLPEPECRARLAELARLNLVELRGRDRYAVHGLLRAYGAELDRGSSAVAVA
ncbi:AfsR/SARP family transcriptional regulator [Kribbella deserti]|uniref:BTAD domain-containing putative transcriptional regulator n=1 Tax=Kribbella deserti TaxID=1926257 RepID=A0ABV6QN12_9ACTN